MRFVYIIVAVLIIQIPALAQQWAGQDTSTCGVLGAMIGSNDACPGCCYFWSPAGTLSDASAKNPIATPTTETVYTVVVTDHNLKKIGSDQVTVRIGFGEMVFSPDFLTQGDTTKKVTASLLKHEGVNTSNQISWNFYGSNLGCAINPSGIGAKIKPGNEYGKVTIEASKVAVAGCYVRNELDVNNGVKDVFAIDPDHPGRVAKTGETLYLIDHEPTELNQPVTLLAIPNAGGFAPGIPDWKQDQYGSQVPEDGEKNPTISEEVIATDKISEYIAGDNPDFMPKVTVIRKPVQGTTTSQFISPGFSALATKIKNIFVFKKGDGPPPICGSNDPFSINVTTPIIEGSMTEVEVYNNPKTSFKRIISAEAALTVAGRIYHPAFTKSIQSKIFNFQICSQLYGEMTAGLGAAIYITKDPSKPDSSWTAPQNEIFLTLGIGGGLDLGVAPPGFKFLITGKISSSCKVSFYLEGLELKAKGIINPLTLKVQAKIQQQTDPGKYEDCFYGLGNLSHEIQLFDKLETTPVVLHSFQN